MKEICKQVHETYFFSKHYVNSEILHNIYLNSGLIRSLSIKSFYD